MFHSFSVADSSTLRRRMAVPWRSPRLYVAGVMGALFGLFLYSYWLVDLLPAGSRLLTLLTLLTAMIGAVGYYALLVWAAPRLGVLPGRTQAVLWAISLLCGAALLFGGTTGWLSPSRSVPFLLPIHTMQLEASGRAGNSGLGLLWFNTSQGDVSYDTLHYSGWKRVGDLLVLQDSNNNSLSWSGRTGSSVEMVWRAPAGASIQLAWDGKAESLRPAEGKYNYSRAFVVPWYASRGLVLALGIFLLASLVAALTLLLWERREGLLSGLQQSFATVYERLGWLDAAALAGGAVVALFLRLPNLGGSYPAVDEYYHLIAARQIIDGATLSSVYERGLWMVTIPVSLALRLFGYQLWAARLPGMIVNILALLPLYLLARRINRPVAVLSVLLYAASPWTATFGRIAREYAYYPFFFFWVILAMVLLLEQIPQRFVLLRDWRESLSAKTILLALALVLPPLWAFYGDRLSTFRTILIAYLVLGVFLLARFDLRERSNWPFLGALGVGLVVTGFAWFERQKSKIVAVPAFNATPVSYFVPDPQQQWYFDRLVPVILLALLGALLCGYLLRRVNIVPLFMFGLYGAYITFFAFLSKTFFHTRHLLTTELWFVILIAVALYVLWKAMMVLIPWKRLYLNALVAVVLGLGVINWQHLLAPIDSTNADNPISEDYLHDMSQVHAYMVSHVQPADVLVSTVYGLYSSWQEEPRFQTQYRITTETPSEQVLAYIDQHESGWIVIDQIRLGMSTLGPRPFAGNRDVEYIGLFGDENVWHWQHAAGGLGNSALAGKGAWIFHW